MSEPNFPPHPNGATCADCVSMTRCAWLISCQPTNTTCDWSPSRFVQIAKVIDGKPPEQADPRDHDARTNAFEAALKKAGVL